MVRRIIVAVTGASGAVYARRLIECLIHAGVETHLVCSAAGKRLFHDELGIKQIDALSLLGRQSELLVMHAFNDIGSKLASGSFRTDGMIICPATVSTMGAVAAGLGDNLITRAAAVTLKEVRRLVVVPREMPLGQIELRNALRISKAGGIICPPAPGFYMNPKSIDDLVDFVVGKLLDLVGVHHDLPVRWGGGAS
jgi:4-hydroxy-3-polyprenylbenzoate decarboxylase